MHGRLTEKWGECISANEHVFEVSKTSLENSDSQATAMLIIEIENKTKINVGHD